MTLDYLIVFNYIKTLSNVYIKKEEYNIDAELKCKICKMFIDYTKITNIHINNKKKYQILYLPLMCQCVECNIYTILHSFSLCKSKAIDMYKYVVLFTKHNNKKLLISIENFLILPNIYTKDWNTLYFIKNIDNIHYIAADII